jgi:hypothetical protein
MEYGAIVWDPYTTVDTNKLERIHRRAARFVFYTKYVTFAPYF